MLCPICQAELCYSERNVFFVDDEIGGEIDMLVKAMWCGECGEVAFAKRVGD